MDPTIEIRELTKHFRGKPAVDHLSLSVPGGSIFALLGDNGAGKTTTIRMLTGLLRPDSGRAINCRPRLLESSSPTAPPSRLRARTTEILRLDESQ